MHSPAPARSLLVVTAPWLAALGALAQPESERDEFRYELPPPRAHARTVALLGEACRDPQLSVRERAAWELGQTCRPEAALYLEACLKDQAWQVRAAAAHAMRDLVQNSAFYAADVRQIRTVVLPALRRALTDQRSEVVCIAAGALTDLGDRACLGSLRKLVGAAQPNVAVAALQGLERLGMSEEATPIVKRLADPDLRVRLASLRALEALAPAELAKAVEPLASDSNSAVRVHALRTLGRMQRTQSAPVVLAACRDANPLVRAEAVDALAFIQGKKACDQLIQSLNDKDYQVQASAARQLGRLGAADVLERLIDLFGHSHIDVRNAAAQAVAAIGGQGAADLCAKGMSHQSAWVRANCSRVLGELGSRTKLQDHLALLADPSVIVRRSAGKALGQIGDSRAVRPLINVLGKGRYPSRKDPDDSVNPDDDREVLRHAAVSLGQLGSPEAIPALARLVPPRRAAAPVRLAAAWALGRIATPSFGEVDVISLLAARVREIHVTPPEDPDMRLESAKALGRIKDPAALPALREIYEGRFPYPDRCICRWAIEQITGQSVPPVPVPPPGEAEAFIMYLRPQR